MTWKIRSNMRPALLATALIVPSAALAQASWTHTDWDGDSNIELSDSEFQSSFAEIGTYDAWDRDDEAGLNEGKFATGVLSSWDTDDDLQITEEEYGAGTERWYGADFATPFSDYDTNTSGYIDTSKFGAAWNNDTYSGSDPDGDSLLTEDEFNIGVYNAADFDSNQIITVEEEG
ncbi:MAG: hypothetical protein ACU0DH_15795 [Paracoccus sp. (in: a-proteobacteria)]|uniref:hypothetical protein n=1 Tax=Paracoccus sp. TaxID=267 RepID=UPI004057EC8A